MVIAAITSRRCFVNASACVSDENHVDSRVFVDLTIESQECGNVYADVRQVTRKGAERESFVVTPPQGYDGSLNVHVFQGPAKLYDRHAVSGTWGMGSANTVWRSAEGCAPRPCVRATRLRKISGLLVLAARPCAAALCPSQVPVGNSA